MGAAKVEYEKGPQGRRLSCTIIWRCQGTLVQSIGVRENLAVEHVWIGSYPFQRLKRQPESVRAKCRLDKLRCNEYLVLFYEIAWQL
eukprot:scaffold3351_cov80-Cylindrotheca_fusiformis.AAC.1